MSRNPNAILVASIRPPNGQLDAITEIIENGEDLQIGDNLYAVSVGDNEDYGICLDEGFFAIHTNVSSKWGDLVEISEVIQKITDFTEDVKSYCKAHNCTYTIYLTANYW